jgi:chitinase
VPGPQLPVEHPYAEYEAPPFDPTKTKVPPIPDEAWIIDDEPKRRLSVIRVLMAMILLAGLGYGGYLVARTRLAPPVAIRKTWFAPYVDVTLPPVYQFQSTSADPARQTALGFVVSTPGQPCTPSWGAAYSLSAADQSLALGSRIAQLQQDGAQPIVSFGGAAHTNIDVGCTQVPALTRAYQTVITRYHLTTIDLDVEGAALDDFAASQRRAAALAALQRSAAAQHRQLAIWLTLPVEPTGLSANAVSVISTLLAHRVAFTGVNIMTMDFRNPPRAGSTMLTLTEDALDATHEQLTKLMGRYGIILRSAQVWQRIGATVMIGQNDVRGEIFTTGDAAGLTTFATRNGLGRLSMWSLNRDSQCGTSFPETGLMSNTCSGTAQNSLEFASTFAKLPGAAIAFANLSAQVRPPKPDKNPADAPFPIWSPTEPYPAGYKVVEHGEIYAAKWYNSQDDPAAVVQYTWQTPWELIGPVLPTDHPPVLPTLPAGTYPPWQKGTAYHADDKVLFHGLPYQAKWDNQGVSPGTAADDPGGSPWTPLFKIPGEPAG